MRILAVAALIVATALPALADSPIPERRLVVHRNSDFFGADIRQLFDTTYQTCRTACLSDQSCAGFTFNSRSNACFTKSELQSRSAYEGAFSAEVIEVAPDALALAETRRADLAFLRESDLNAALTEAVAVPGRHTNDGWTVAELLQAASNARFEGNPGSALQFTGMALGVSDAADLWTEYARLALDMPAGTSSSQRDFHRRALSGAINAYLRAGSDPVRVSALQVMAQALESLGRGRPQIPTLRLAQSISPRADVAAALEDAIGKYGFRITEHRSDSDNTDPRICADFSEPLVQAGVDYAPYVSAEVPGLATSVEGSSLCLSGVTHGERYSVTFRKGLPAASGEKMSKSVSLTVYVRDRSPAARFPGRGYILPSGGDISVPIVTVNLDRVDLSLTRVSDRNVVRAIQNDMFGKPIPQYMQTTLDQQIGAAIWSGEGDVVRDLNRDVTTRLPVGEIVGDMPPGIYVLRASIPDADPWEFPPATQWFVVSDLGLTTLDGSDGLHVFLRGLGDAAPVDGAEVTLISRANAVLGTAETDAQGYARFAPGLSRGTGGTQPALLVARNGDDDLAFLPLTDPEFDLSDRGVAGRAPSGPIDVFLTTERGAYRAGETITATALVRDARARALDGLPLTAVLYRPDGVEYHRETSALGLAGGHVFRVATHGGVPRGTWRLDIRAEEDGPALASQDLLIEDFRPERIDADLTLPDSLHRVRDTLPLTVEARYLFGAPGAGLTVDGSVTVRAVRGLDGWPGYRFGRRDGGTSAVTGYMDLEQTDGDGVALLAVPLPEPPANGRPLEATITVRVAEGSGRPIERQVETPLLASGPMIGIRPNFDGTLPEGGEASFDLIALDAAQAQTGMDVQWTIDRVERHYQWFSLYGDWQWEPVVRRHRVASGDVRLGDGPVTVTAPVGWGRYELRVEKQGGDYVAASSRFYAGWYSDGDVSATPDVLALSLDAEGYRPGDTATVRLVPRHAGKALITVLSDRLIDMKAVDVVEGENLVTLDVTEAWGAGAYVTASVLKPTDIAGGHNPARSLGLAHAAIDPGPAQLAAAFDMPDTAMPRQAMPVALKVDGIAPGETAYAMIAAVDVGILNLTGFDAPDPSGHYFGQRRLGVGIRDVYGRLIDAFSGETGRLRSGGDVQGNMQSHSPPPTEALLALAEGPLVVDADGYARTSLDLPAFNGTVRLMAVVWSPTGVGEAAKDVLVRDPVVITPTLPGFLAPGDSSRLLVELHHADGPAGPVRLAVAGEGVVVRQSAIPKRINLGAGEKTVLAIPIEALEPGDHTLRLSLITADGTRLERRLTLPVRQNDPVTTRTSRFDLAAGATFGFDDAVFTGFRPGTGRATLTAGPLARLDAPGLLSALDRYPYGCTEQVTSRAMPLLYLDDVATAMGLARRVGLRDRLDLAVARLLANQGSGGGFGLWRPGSGDIWLDAYVTDFLSRARAQGVAVPDTAFRTALDNLANRVAYAPDFDRGGQDIAYALYVLAREGQAAISDLRYYADVKGNDLATPLAQAQLGAALAAYGDPTRADMMFRFAAKSLAALPVAPQRPIWRLDYGSHLRDRAAVLTLAVEAGSDVIDRQRLARAIVVPERAGHLSTQEAVWSLMAANALIGSDPGGGLSVDGTVPDGPLIRFREAGAAAGSAIRNEGDRTATLTLTTYGVPDVPEAAGGEGFTIERRYFTLQGDPADLDTISAGDRLVTVLTVIPHGSVESRLMVNDPLPAGFEIDNPNLIRAGDIRSLDWLDVLENVETSEFRTDRFLAAVDWRSQSPFRLAYVVRAISPGSYHHPAATVEDMYRPRYRAHTDTGQVQIGG